MAENDSTLCKITQLLTQKYRCHTVVLYGSRARGQTTPTSDYDVVGVCKRGSKTRIAKKENGKFWGVFVYSEKDLRKLSDQHLSWKHAQILYSAGPYGKNLLNRIEKLLKKPFKPHPKYEFEIMVQNSFAANNLVDRSFGESQSSLETAANYPANHHLSRAAHLYRSEEV